jgi:hypothetical protein
MGVCPASTAGESRPAGYSRPAGGGVASPCFTALTCGTISEAYCPSCLRVQGCIWLATRRRGLLRVYSDGFPLCLAQQKKPVLRLLVTELIVVARKSPYGMTCRQPAGFWKIVNCGSCWSICPFSPSPFHWCGLHQGTSCNVSSALENIRVRGTDSSLHGRR